MKKFCALIAVAAAVAFGTPMVAHAQQPGGTVPQPAATPAAQPSTPTLYQIPGTPYYTTTPMAFGSSYPTYYPSSSYYPSTYSGWYNPCQTTYYASPYSTVSYWYPNTYSTGWYSGSCCRRTYYRSYYYPTYYRSYCW